MTDPRQRVGDVLTAARSGQTQRRVLNIDSVAGDKSIRTVARYSAVWANTGEGWRLVCWPTTPAT
jgi:hypothetical protein